MTDHKAIREASDLVSQLVGALELCQRALQSQWSPYLRAGDKEAAAMKAAASALSAAKAGGWQDISTAPKDGTAVLVSEGRFCWCVEWNEEFDWWAVDDNKLGPFRLRGAAPTHWQPLPAPPAQMGEG